MMEVREFFIGAHGGERRVPMPAGAHLFACAYSEMQSTILLWARVNDSNPQVDRVIEVTQTGCTAPDRGRPIGTALDQHSDVAYHVFDLGEAQ